MVDELLDGRYKVVRTLGSGGFGHTFLAEDTRRPGNPLCVIKQLQLASSNPEFLSIARRLFAAEAEVLEKIRHPQIPQLLAYFEAHKKFYLVQDFVDGKELSTMFNQQEHLSEKQVLQLLEDVLGILEFIHARNVIHRDIKPDNLIYRSVDKKFVLIDFGAVKEVQKIAEGDSDTHTISIGTQGYIPLEQLRGKPRYSSDIYALGMTALHALTGLHPSQLPEDPATGEILWQDYVSNINPQLAHVLTKMVRYSFQERYQNASEALRELKNTPSSTVGFAEHTFISDTDTSKASQVISDDKNQNPTEVSLQPTDTSDRRIKPETTEVRLKRTASAGLLIVRDQAQRLQAKFAESLEQKNPAVVFHIYGIGGIGKTTLLKELQEEHSKKAHFVWFSFELSLGIETPLKFMAKLYEEATKVTKPSFWQHEVFAPPDVFTSLYEKYQETLSELETQPVEGKGQVSAEQLSTVKQLMKFGFGTVGKVIPISGVTASTLEKLAEPCVDAATLLLSEKDRLQQLLQRHRATRKRKELQALLLEPLIKLTKAFAEGLIRKAKKRPIILVLDAYEKAPLEVNSWLWQYLLANTELRHHNIRMVIAGRESLLRQEGWRRLYQDWQLVYETSLGSFTEQQTKIYLTESNIRQNNQIQAVYESTKGLPYYLNWIREQKEQRIDIDYSQGNNEIAKVLLQGLDRNQKKIVQFIACCHWFDKGLLEYLVKQLQQSGDLQFTDDHFDYFEWLKNRGFVRFVQNRYRMDEVARLLFRSSLGQDNPDLFHKVNLILANYFEQKAEILSSPNSSLNEQIENPDWCTYKSEVLYHRLFSEPGEKQREFLSQLASSSLLTESRVMRNTFVAIATEAGISDHPLLKHPAKEFLTSININQGATFVSNPTTIQFPEDE